MKITVSLDTQSVITQPSPLRFKAACFNLIEIAFTRGSQSIPLPDGAVIEFALKPRNQWTGGLLAYLNAFAPAAGNFYTGALNCATAALLNALGLSDQVPANDVAQVDASAEVTWSFGGQKFRSTTFPVTVEAPLADTDATATPDPELYPPPGEIALKSDIPQLPEFGTAALLDAGMPNGVATLDGNGKVPLEQMPPISAGVKLIYVADAAERLALTPAQVAVGDIVKESDTRALFLVLDTSALTEAQGYAPLGTHPGSVTLNDGVLAVWRLDEQSGTRVDATGHGYDLSDLNGVGYAPGKFGNAAHFTGNGEYLSGTLDTYHDVFTLSCWVKSAAPGQSAGMPFPSFWYGGNNVGIGTSADGTLFCWGGIDFGIGTHPINDGQWHHVACRSSDGANVDYFVDGVLDISQMPWNPEHGAGINLSNGDTDELGLVGSLDHTCVWSRTLSDEEISELYNHGNGLTYPY